jgi:hypothetical protein
MNAMDDAPQLLTVKQFTAAMLESSRHHTDMGWVVARTRLSEELAWLAGFDENKPVWTAIMDKAAIYDRDGAELARRWCTETPDHSDIFYAVCRLKDAETDNHGHRAKRVSDFEAGMLNAVRELNSNEELRQQIAKRIS